MKNAFTISLVTLFSMGLGSLSCLAAENPSYEQMIGTQSDPNKPKPAPASSFERVAEADRHFLEGNAPAAAPQPARAQEPVQSSSSPAPRRNANTAAAAPRAPRPQPEPERQPA